MAAIRPFTPEYDEYLKDESRSVGEAQTVSFPADEEQVRAIIDRASAVSDVTVSRKGANPPWAHELS